MQTHEEQQHDILHTQAVQIVCNPQVPLRTIEPITAKAVMSAERFLYQCKRTLSYLSKQNMYCIDYDNTRYYVQSLHEKSAKIVVLHQWLNNNANTHCTPPDTMHIVLLHPQVAERVRRTQQYYEVL